MKKIIIQLIISFISMMSLLSYALEKEPDVFWKLLDKNHPKSGLNLVQVELSGIIFELELAETETTLEKGLMERYLLPFTKGMLFVFNDSPKIRHFWMKNTKIPLEILFFDEKGRLINIQEASPCTTEICPVYSSIEPSALVIEIAKGSRKKYGIMPRMLLKNFKKID